MQDKKTLNNEQRTEKTPSAAEKAAFIALFQRFYKPGLFSIQWGPDLRVLREAANPRALAESHNGSQTVAAMAKVRNAEAKSLAGQVQVDTPAQGDCLFWAVMLGALIRANGTDRFELVVSQLFGEEPTPVDAKQLSKVLLPSYQGRVSDIVGYENKHAFYALMMRFRARIANYIAQTSELHASIEGGDAKAYGQRMLRARTWGGEVEIKAMAALLEMDIIVHRDPGSPMHRIPAVVGEQTEEALPIAQVSASAGSSVRNHYRFYVPEAKISWSREVSLVEQAARAAHAKYQTWRLSSYPVMNLLGTLLHSRLPSQPSDHSFDEKILSVLVYANRDHLTEKKSTSVQSVAGMFMDKYNRGNQAAFDFSAGRDAKFPASLRTLLGGLADQVDQRIASLRRMDPNLMSVMASFLTLKDQNALIQTCKELCYKGIGRKVRVNRLLSLVAQGRQAEAEAIIQNYPSLLLARGDVTDSAGRTFRGITALQTAVWALDAHMWRMMLPYFDRLSARSSAGDQLQLLEEKGTAHGRHFDFQPLLDAYAAYERSPSEETWCRGVGGEQRRLPDHVVQEYTTPDRPFRPVPDFRVQSGRPGVHADRGGMWWRSGELNITRAKIIVRSKAAAVARGSMFRAFKLANPSCEYSRADRAAVQALCSQRERDLSALLESFNIRPSQAPESKLPGKR